MYEGPGRYRHYKGGEYDVLGLAFAERFFDMDFAKADDPTHQQVVYRPTEEYAEFEGTGVTLITRGRLDFDAVLDFGNGGVDRFEKLG